MDAEHDEALLRSAGADADAGADGGSPSIEAEEQAHLDEVLGAVRAAVDRARGLAERTEGSHREAGAQLAASRGELAPEEAHLSAYELNRMDAQAALAHRSRGRLEKLLDSPYFARVDFVEGEEGASSSAGSAEGETAAARQITYLGRFALTWENQALISDWRSPVAALFYDFEPGPAAFEAPAGRREGTLALKRQISIEEGQLRYAVDSSSSVRDEVLATVLGRTSDAKMHDIVSSIQREQNAVVRHEDVPVLQVAGIAGSGKTSVLMQRIAYLFYQHRGALDPTQVFLISPNPVFGRYIDRVLPDLGERNPEILTWEEFLMPLLPAGRGVGESDVSLERLHAIDAAVASFEFTRSDFRDITSAGVRLLGGDAVEKVSAKFANLPAGPHRATLMAEELSSRLTARLKSLAALEDTHDEIASLPVDEQLRLFGEVFDPQSDEEARTLALTYLEEKHADALRAMDAMEWLDIDRVAARLLGREGLTSVEWVYLKMALTGLGNPEARYVMIDEAQDYSQGQLAVLARYFRRAHFLLLGDPNQAIFEGTATWDEMRAVFEEMRGAVSQCRLMTSYRSTPAITDLFARLLPAGEAMEVASVQREAPAPEIVVCEGTDEWKAALAEAVRVARDAGGLTAVIVPWKNDAKRLAKALDGVTAGSGQPPVGGDLGRPSAASDANAGQGVVVLGEGDSLPDEGIVVVPLKLAKGLEFDRVVIPDASARTFPESDIARRRLYTTISRGTRHLTILSNGDLTELLG